MTQVYIVFTYDDCFLFVLREGLSLETKKTLAHVSHPESAPPPNAEAVDAIITSIFMLRFKRMLEKHTCLDREF